jgi:hypothetical protein
MSDSYKHFADKSSKIADKTTTTICSALEYAMKHYPNAPPLTILEDPLSLLAGDKDDYTEDDIVLDITDNGSKKKLPVFLANMIITCYKKKNPQDQKMWGSDCSRLNYIVRIIVEGSRKKKMKWEQDPNGNTIKSFIIKPLLDKIKIILQKYAQGNTEPVSRDKRKKVSNLDDTATSDDDSNSDRESSESSEDSVDSDDRMVNLKRRDVTLSVIKSINDHSLATNILKVMAPEFKLKIDMDSDKKK